MSQRHEMQKAVHENPEWNTNLRKRTTYEMKSMYEMAVQRGMKRNERKRKMKCLMRITSKMQSPVYSPGWICRKRENACSRQRERESHVQRNKERGEIYAREIPGNESEMKRERENESMKEWRKWMNEGTWRRKWEWRRRNERRKEKYRPDEMETAGTQNETNEQTRKREPWMVEP